ncbi:LuxR C-terminal-related transcriptional regulator [uncultured Adlercreutzia sp.]|uniref:LuxR C-terminal-related transcriptional regulator n=1 Tax=uncultured Adlercreutzia sp. TaxID=875803 RepID=UPI0026F3F507|nr:LuxR C-terminal-related transcriptional regulator [uncultured Adlercreutzia sp.]
MKDALLTLYRNGSLLGMGVAAGWVLCWLAEISSVFEERAVVPALLLAGLVLLGLAVGLQRNEERCLALCDRMARMAPGLCVLLYLGWAFSPLWLGSASMLAGMACVIVGIVLVVLYGPRYARLALVDVMLIVCIAWALAAGLFVLYLCLPPQLCPWLMLAMVWLMSVLLQRNRRLPFYRSRCSESRPMEMPSNPSFTRQDGYSTFSIVFYAASSGMAFAALAGLASVYAQIAWGSAVGTVVLLVLAFYAFAFHRTVRLMFVWHGVEMATVVCCLLLISGHEAVVGFVCGLFCVAFASYPFQVWMKAVTYCKRMNVPPLLPFALLGGALLVALGAGFALGQLLCWATDGTFACLFCAIVGVMLSVVAFFYSRDYGRSASKEPAVVVGFSDREVIVADDAVDASIQRASQQLGFTAREQEIIRLVSQGRTMQFTADELGISINTVRGHMKRIYGKLDVHSREEMLDVLEKYRV